MRIEPIFAWYDLWVGAYWDKANKRLYVLPMPCFGVVIDFARRSRDGQRRDYERARRDAS